MAIDLLSNFSIPQEWGNMSIDFVSLLVGLLLSASIVVASHLATQVVARDLPGTRVAGDLAIPREQMRGIGERRE